MSAYIMCSCKLYMLQIIEDSMNMLNALENCSQFINYNGGFTVIGWYKSGVIDDKSLVDSRKMDHYNGGNIVAK